MGSKDILAACRIFMSCYYLYTAYGYMVYYPSFLRNKDFEEYTKSRLIMWDIRILKNIIKFFTCSSGVRPKKGFRGRGDLYTVNFIIFYQSIRPRVTMLKNSWLIWTITGSKNKNVSLIRKISLICKGMPRK
jgi:hypothetical protein